MMDNTGKGQWFVLHTLSGQENRVRENIEGQIKLEDPSIPVYEVLIPTEKLIEVKNGVKKETKRKLFPGYVFCRMALYRENGDRDEEIGTWINMPEEDAAAARPAVTYQIGDRVRIKDGPFENFTAAVGGVDAEHGKLKLTVSIFGRSTPIEVEFWQVERDEE